MRKIGNNSNRYNGQGNAQAESGIPNLGLFEMDTLLKKGGPDVEQTIKPWDDSVFA